jgi:hypothetical protein
MFDTIILKIRFRNYHKHLEYYSFLVYDDKGELKYLEENSLKLEDVSKMPNYIQEDFFKYNSKELTLEKFETFLSNVWFHQDINSDDTEIKIKEIKRDLKLKSIL